MKVTINWYTHVRWSSGSAKSPGHFIGHFLQNSEKFKNQIVTLLMSNSLDLGGCGEDVACPQALIELNFKKPLKSESENELKQAKDDCEFF